MASGSAEATTMASKVRLGSIADSLGESFSKLRLSDQFADFLVSCKSDDKDESAFGERNNAHRNVLAARSPVFATMLNNDKCEEVKKGRIVIDDYDADVVAAMLDYMYTSSCEIEPKSVQQLLSISEKYKLTDLKDLCDEQLSKQVDLESAVDVALFADLHSAPKARRAAVELLAQHYDSLRSVSLTNSVIDRFNGNAPLIHDFFLAMMKCFVEEIIG